MFRDFVPGALIFLGIFGIGLCVQYVAWTMHNDVVDQYIWSNAVIRTSEDLLFQPEVGPEIVNSAYGYPGTTIIIPSALLVRYGISPFKALQDVLSFSIAAGIAATVLMCYRLRPSSPWWVATALLLLFSDLYYIATPASSVMTIWAAFIVLSTLYIAEHAEEKNLAMFALLGAASGYAVATRFDISLMLSASVFVFLVATFRKIPWVYVTACTASLLLFDPYLWAGPIQHLSIFIFKSTAIQGLDHSSKTDWLSHFSNANVIFETAPPAVLSFLGALLLLRWPALAPFSRNTVVWLLTTTIIIFSILFALSFHPQWYFFPVYVFWETLLPLGLWTFFDAISGLSLLSRSAYPYVLFGGVFAMQLFLFIRVVLA